MFVILKMCFSSVNCFSCYYSSFEPRVAYCDAAAAIDDDYLAAAIRKMSADTLQLQTPTYIPTSSKVYNIQPKPLFSAFEFRALAMTTVRSLLMFYLPLLEPKPASEDDDDFLNNAAEERRGADLIVPLKKSVKQIAREVSICLYQRVLRGVMILTDVFGYIYDPQTTVVTTRRVLERLAISYVSQRMAWKLLKGNVIFYYFAFPNNKLVIT